MLLTQRRRLALSGDYPVPYCDESDQPVLSGFRDDGAQLVEDLVNILMDALLRRARDEADFRGDNVQTCPREKTDT